MDLINKQSHKADLNYLRQSMSMPLLEREHEEKLTKAWHDTRNQQALHTLIRSYIRLVISIALRYRHYGLPLADIIQEGNLGLLHAAERFDPKREVRFSAYAKWWIRAHIQDFVLRNWSIVRTGSTTSQKVLFFNLNRLRNKLTKISTDLMNPEEQRYISDTLNVSVQDVRNMESRLLYPDLSLSASISEGGENKWEDLLRDERPSPEEASVKQHDNHVCQKWIAKAMDCLNPIERLIIMKRWLSDSPMTLEVLGIELKLTKERVRQIEARSIRKLRHFLMNNVHGVREILD
ncbi:RNA polymerase factor sigma-32 [Candidatus Finniella inopinata]|uniref:RNA polymerase factor sigma-32 n=1 Tax=Candidatus Finniella inopinata TaxID=1696036 RepID=A0A4Q7DGU2_9PROT|nr:RNA polymerase factor sigma-32 [Candidatus Finniella inopinata]RZI45902.1 RNA polymerase factor sigma-32 [Candidatus Finniella inopinata]